MLPSTQFILVIVLLLVALWVLTAEMRYNPRGENDLPEELSANPTPSAQQKETKL
ncbi:MAG: hypothetical protein NT075_06585 [Chloroflexi bacterium]|nr:hypothetical protein [Chloroflexota bacterium]